MAKYSYEFKKKIVTAYLNGEGGYLCLAKNMVFLIRIALSYE